MTDDELREKLAELEHKQWMCWAKDIMKQEKISKKKIIRWKKCMIPYKKLSEEMKDFDRKWADVIISIIHEYNISQKNNYFF